MINEEELHDAFHRRFDDALARLYPSPQLLPGLRRRARRHRRATIALSSAVGALTIAGLLGAHYFPYGHQEAATLTNPLVDSGPCAGLTLDAETNGGNVSVAPGAGSTPIAMPLGGQLRLVATGPCADTLAYETIGTILGGSSAYSGGYFSASGVATFDALRPGRQQISFVLGCPGRAVPCLDNLNPKLAVLEVVVEPPPGPSKLGSS